VIVIGFGAIGSSIIPYDTKEPARSTSDGICQQARRDVRTGVFYGSEPRVREWFRADSPLDEQVVYLKRCG